MRGFDRHPPDPPGPDDIVIGSLEDEAALGRAMATMGAAVHLAADADPEADWESLLGANIIGTRDVHGAARRAGVRRVVFASSSHVGRIDTREGRIASASRARAAPDLYGVSKAFGEALGRYYADRHGLSVIWGRGEPERGLPCRGTMTSARRPARHRPTMKETT